MWLRFDDLSVQQPMNGLEAWRDNGVIRNERACGAAAISMGKQNRHRDYRDCSISRCCHPAIGAAGVSSLCVVLHRMARSDVEAELAVTWCIQQRRLKLESRKGPKRGL